MNPASLETAFQETLHALGPKNRENIVVVGGWCPYLYAKYLWRKNVPFPQTLDIDLAVKNMTPDGFSRPVYEALLRGNLVAQAIDIDDNNRFQFHYLNGRQLVKVEFVTSPRVLPEGQKTLSSPHVICAPVSSVEIALLAPSVRCSVPFRGDVMDLQVTSPSAFIIMKALLVANREETGKIGKDLESIAFVLFYAPDPKAVIRDIRTLSHHPPYKEFVKIMRGLFHGPLPRAIDLLRPGIQSWGIPTSEITNVVRRTFSPLLDEIG